MLVWVLQAEAVEFEVVLSLYPKVDLNNTYYYKSWSECSYTFDSNYNENA
jgi:hypothetical protein